MFTPHKNLKKKKNEEMIMGSCIHACTNELARLEEWPTKQAL
jgi:hypothetical protein